MFSSIVQGVRLCLATINIAGLISTIYQKLHRNKAPQQIGYRTTPKQQKNADIEVFNKINPYLQGITYAYSAYRLLSEQNDPIAYVGTCLAVGQLYFDLKDFKKNSASNNISSTQVMKRRFQR